MTDGDPRSHTIAVIGGGIAGITAAVEVAETGYDVVLLDKGPALGGRDGARRVVTASPATLPRRFCVRVHKPSCAPADPYGFSCPPCDGLRFVGLGAALKPVRVPPFHCLDGKLPGRPGQALQAADPDHALGVDRALSRRRPAGQSRSQVHHAVRRIQVSRRRSTTYARRRLRS